MGFAVHRSHLLLLLAAAAAGVGTACRATPPEVMIHVSGEMCAAGSLNVPCSEIGAKLREVGTPRDAHIRFAREKGATYRGISAALTSLLAAGFRFKVGYVNVREEPTK